MTKLLFLLLFVIILCPLSADAAQLTGGLVIVGNQTHGGFGSEIIVSNILGQTIEFIPIPSNATITSIEWESDIIPIVYPNQIKTPTDDFSYNGGDNYLSVTVNGTFTLTFRVWEQ